MVHQRQQKSSQLSAASEPAGHWSATLAVVELLTDRLCSPTHTVLYFTHQTPVTKKPSIRARNAPTVPFTNSCTSVTREDM